MKIKLKSEIGESWLKEKVLLPMLSKKIVSVRRSDERAKTGNFRTDSKLQILNDKSG